VYSDACARSEELITFCFPGAGFSVLGAGLSGGAALRWLSETAKQACRVLGQEPGIADTYEAFSDAASEIAPGSEGIVFLPLLAGARHAPESSAIFTGLRAHHGFAHIVRSVMEGVVWELRHYADQFPGDRGKELVAAGGGMSSDVWAGIAAGIFGLWLRRAACREQAALGAALLAGVGLGVYPDVAAAASVVPIEDRVIAPTQAPAYKAMEEKIPIHYQFVSSSPVR
jgi:xylulokinase